MRKPNIWMIICIFAILALSHQTLIHHLGSLSEIRLSQISVDAAIYLSISASYLHSKNKSLQIIILLLIIPVDLMAHIGLTQGYLIYLSYSTAYLLAGITIFAMFPQYKWVIFFCIMMFSYQLFMSLGYYLGQELEIYAMAKTTMFIHYKSFLYGIHLLILISITRWAIILRFRAYLSYYIGVLWIKLGAYFVR